MLKSVFIIKSVVSGILFSISVTSELKLVLVTKPVTLSFFSITDIFASYSIFAAISQVAGIFFQHLSIFFATFCLSVSYFELLKRPVVP